jgi:hypothetical protein
MLDVAIPHTRPARTELEELETRLQSQLGSRVRDLRLEMEGDAIVLRGYARTYYVKQVAQQTVMRLTDLPILANEIEVY